MRHVLHVENSPTIRAGVRGLCRRVPGIELAEAGSLDAARREIRTLGFDVFSLAILDWSLPDGCARVLLPLLSSSRVVILSAKPPVLPGVVVIQKEGEWWLRLETELRK